MSDLLARRMAAAALDYAARGMAIFPCWPGNKGGSRAKEPLTTHGLHDATTDPEQVREWWARWPQAAIGMPTGVQFDVIDMDRKPGGVDGGTAVAFLHGLRLLDGIVRGVRTPSGGAHLLFPANVDDPMPNQAWAKVGIDLRGVGGYVIAPPSYIDTGTYSGSYVVVAEYPGNGQPLDWKAVRRVLVGDPPEVRRRAVGDARRAGGIEPLSRFVAASEPGERNHRLFWAACRAAEQGLDPGPLADAATAVGLSQIEVQRTIRSATKEVGQ